MKRKVIYLLLVVCVSVLVVQNLLAGDPCIEGDVEKVVNDAVAILEAKGEAGLKEVGEIRFCGDNYIFVNDFEGKTLMHIKPNLIGKVLIALKDDTGKRFFADFTELAMSSETTKDGKTYYNGNGWVRYRWPKPGEEAFSPKLSFIRGCLMGGKNVYVGAGIYE